MNRRTGLGQDSVLKGTLKANSERKSQEPHFFQAVCINTVNMEL